MTKSSPSNSISQDERDIEVKAPLPAELLARCRKMRKDAPDAETLLWHLLRDRQLLGFKFHRQHVIEGYIADFYCHSARLVVEVDGGGHAEEEQARYDAERTIHLQALGLLVIRFWNDDVLKQTEDVLQEIAAELERHE